MYVLLALRSALLWMLAEVIAEKQNIGLQARVSLLLGPEIERQSCQIINLRHGVTIFREIDALHVALAAVAGLDPRVLKLLGRINRQLVLVLLATVGTKHAPKLPFRTAKKTDQRTFCAIAVLTKHRQLWRIATSRTLPQVIRGLDLLLSQETSLPIHGDEDPLNCGVRGTGRILDDEEKYWSVLSA